ncbi:hypothetical protein BBOV_III006790 [Babesia bovis T2Bo]|uniref:Uncharacterized protein n=1 Tax=Babesia bovis TaxID=5865 RepID=A7ANV6_BABBO|nr:hypothetical protein BBOV_III006790 [Babesia bovis T2Bo]EDO08240.1 hypothetical protein BBOV_III006790 [Babesia bovis T2Bo]|eukprot:XP_001611808.1 hypothetical protein [Babesia bovis T2Bo]
MRIPSASPSSAVVNFETHCTEYFHPSVLAYIIRNRAAQLARYGHGVSVTAKIRDELDRITAAAVSTSCHLSPQTGATLLLSFAKLDYVKPELTCQLTEHFDFAEASPKAIAVVLNAISRQPHSLQHVYREFWDELPRAISCFGSTSSLQDVASCSLSLSKIISACRNAGVSSKIGGHTYRNICNLLKTVLLLAQSRLQESGPQEYKPKELTSILQAAYTIKGQPRVVVIHLLNHLKNAIPTSIYGVDDTLFTLDILPPPDLDGDTIDERRIKRDIARAEKSFVEWAFEYIVDHLKCLSDAELARIAAACNRLRAWSKDEFVCEFALSWEKIIANGDNITPRNLSQAACYFLRRYEASVQKELDATNSEEHLKASQISHICAKIGDILHDYASSRYTKQDLHRVEELMQVADHCRAKRFLKGAA